MQREPDKIGESVMKVIKEGKIKMRPRIYFIAGSVLAFAGLVFSIATSVFLVGLLGFYLRSHGPMFEYRLDRLVSEFPWWTLALAVLSLVAGIWLMRKYDFSYKINLKLGIVVLVLTILLSGFLIDALGFNDLIYRRGGPMRGMMKMYREQSLRVPLPTSMPGMR